MSTNSTPAPSGTPAPGTPTTSAPAATGTHATTHAAHLHRDLHNRHIQMIALGGAIGTGLFYGSASSISLAGPAILFVYLIGGCTIYLVMRALGEMSVHEPVPGAFSHYAYTYWSPRAGFISGWNYWFNYIFVAMSELSVVGLYINYWFPAVPTWLTAAFCLVFITAVNLLGVRAFGEFEFWFALVKVIAIIGMIVLGILVLVVGLQEPHQVPPGTSFAELVFPNGLKGATFAFVVVMFSFGGIELIGITAGEADDPRRSIPRAINLVIQRILIFYVLSLAIIMAVIPWRSIDGHASPFVQIFDSVGITFAAHILNFVVLTAALSVYNSGLYSNGRMLYSLAQQGNAPCFRHTFTSGHAVRGDSDLLGRHRRGSGCGLRFPELRIRVSAFHRPHRRDYQLDNGHDHPAEIPRRARPGTRGEPRLQAPRRPSLQHFCTGGAGGLRGAHAFPRRLPGGSFRGSGLAATPHHRVPGESFA